MPISLETGDIFATDGIHGFAHGCNCAGAMGKGIAISFRKRWPAMYEEYRSRCKTGRFRLGDVFVWEENGDIIFNLGTQKTWTTKAELAALEKSLTEMLNIAAALGVVQIALPRIGAGLGGRLWDDVFPIIERLGNSSIVLLRVCDFFVSGRPLAPTADV